MQLFVLELWLRAQYEHVISTRQLCLMWGSAKQRENETAKVTLKFIMETKRLQELKYCISFDGVFVIHGITIVSWLHASLRFVVDKGHCPLLMI
jgi:hypothetical protein